MNVRPHRMIDTQRLWTCLTFAWVVVSGCGTAMVVTPPAVPLTNVDFRIKGKVIYEGNREYLPRTIVDAAEEDSSLTFQYTYNVTHGKDDVPQLLPLFNPLTLVGFPIGEDTMFITGRLKISKRNEVVKTYTATCGFEKTRNIFWQGETFSELRRKGLIVVRDNIEAQMYQERDLFSKLSTAD